MKTNKLINRDPIERFKLGNIIKYRNAGKIPRGQSYYDNIWNNLKNGTTGETWYQQRYDALKNLGFNDNAINKILDTATTWQSFLNDFHTANPWTGGKQLKVDNKYGTNTGLSDTSFYSAYNNSRNRIKIDNLINSYNNSTPTNTTPANPVSTIPTVSTYSGNPVGNYGKRVFRGMGIKDFNSLQAAALNSQYSANPFIKDMILAFGDPNNWNQNDVEYALGLKGKYRTGLWSDEWDALHRLQDVVKQRKSQNPGRFNFNITRQPTNGTTPQQLVDTLSQGFINRGINEFRDKEYETNTLPSDPEYSDYLKYYTQYKQRGGHLISRDPIERFKLGNKIQYAQKGDLLEPFIQGFSIENLVKPFFGGFNPLDVIARGYRYFTKPKEDNKPKKDNKPKEDNKPKKNNTEVKKERTSGIGDTLFRLSHPATSAYEDFTKAKKTKYMGSYPVSADNRSIDYPFRWANLGFDYNDASDYLKKTRLYSNGLVTYITNDGKKGSVPLRSFKERAAAYGLNTEEEVKKLLRSINSLWGKPVLKEDGKFGLHTEEYVNYLLDKYYKGDESAVNTLAPYITDERKY